MTITKRQRNSETNETPNASSDSFAKQTLIKTSQALYSKDLTDEETKFWIEFIDPMTVQSLRFAFDNWNRNGRFFPKPKDISDLVEAYKLSLKSKELPPGCANCREGWVKVYQGRTSGGNEVDSHYGAVTRCECFADPSLRRRDPHYGLGYGWGDCRWMMIKIDSFFKQFNRKTNSAETEAMLAELDKTRPDGAPGWRRA